NILVIKSVADNYPVNSPLDITGFYDSQSHVVAGENVTLDELEKVTIGNEYDDPRIHFWLNPGAASGYPPVNSKAIMLYNLNELMDEQLTTAINNKEFIALDDEHKEVLVPMIFKINENDFTKDGKTVLDFINTYRKKKIRSDYKINYYSANRDLNDSKERSKTKNVVEEKKAAPMAPKIETPKKDSVVEKPIEKIVEKPIEKPVEGVVEKPVENANKDSVRTAGETLRGDDILSQGSYMLHTVFQIRALGSNNTQHALYNADLNRVDNDYRTSNFTFTVQCWNKLSERVNYGVQFNFRSLVISDINSSPYNTLSFSNKKNSKFYFRDVSNSLKYLFHEGKWRVTGITTILVPGSKNNVVQFKRDSLYDNGQNLWINQLFFNRRFSKYFTLNTDLEGTYRLSNANSTNGFIVRASLLPEFNYWITRSLKFYVFFELNPLVNHGFFSSFYFREGTGFTLVPGKIAQWDLQYYYYALGKKSSAISSLLLAGRFNF
ncbi:MAG: DUF547 domain-containing protein, partial [Bacteroidota bacterium]